MGRLLANEEELCLTTVHIAKALWAPIAGFFKHHTDVFVPLRHKYFGVQLNGIGGVFVQGAVTATGHSFLGVPHAKSSSGRMAIGAQGVGINLWAQAFGAASGQTLLQGGITCAAGGKTVGELILHAVALGQGLIQIIGRFVFSSAQHIGQLLAVGIERQIADPKVAMHQVSRLDDVPFL